MYELIQVSNNSYYVNCPAKSAYIAVRITEFISSTAATIRRPGARSDRYLTKMAGRCARYS